MTILNLKVKYKSFLSRKQIKQINLSIPNHEKLSVNVQQKYRIDVVLEAIFCFAYLKVKDTKYKMLSDRLFDLSTPKLC